MRIRLLVALVLAVAVWPATSAGDREPRRVQPLEIAVRDRLSQPRGEGWILHATGFAFDQRGYAFTNAHAVGRCREITLATPGGTEHPATLIAMDTRYDLAILRRAERFEEVLPVGQAPDRPDVPVIVFSFAGLPKATSGKRAFGSWLTKDPDGREGLAALTSEIQDGQSGSPVLATDGTVLGLVVGRQSDTGKAAVVSVGAMRSFLDYLGLAPPPPSNPAGPIFGPSDVLASDALVAVACR